MALSAFLPDSFDPRRPVALIAGQGRYPALVAESIRAAGVPLRLVAMDEETSPELQATFPESERALIKVGQIGALLKALKKFDAGYAFMAGQVSPRRLFSGLHPDLKALAILATLKRRNAETIFGAIAREIEDIGVHLLDARAFIDAHLATPGQMTRKKFPIDRDYLDHGLHIARECARLDIGQGCVVRKGTVLAVEAYEGTDEMIRRAGTLKTDEGLYVKTVKARQDYRFDVPCFGLITLETLATAQIRAVALEAGRVILIDKPAVLARADQLGISLLGAE
ncbi:MAG: UDP-2,3-diacylglucosamine diphosphatase LpxI [Burkholderiales bacterium]|nr:UDP-2,3-diacylglucosamine diphosphatase LpxI [Opitutaceae bacterium]